MTDPQLPEQEVDDLFALPIRVFEVTYVDGTTETFSSHFYDTVTGHCIFMDRVRVGKKLGVDFNRQVIAAGQWRKVREITGSTQSEGVN